MLQEYIKSILIIFHGSGEIFAKRKMSLWRKQYKWLVEKVEMILLHYLQLK